MNYNKIKHLDAKNNPLLITQNDINTYNDILSIIHTYKCNYGRTRRFKIYIPWINSKTPKLNNPFYQTSTKLYWIFNGWTNFPKCKQCGKVLDKRNVSIARKHTEFCLMSCVASNPEVYAKKECTCEKKYGKGIKNPSQAPNIKAKKEQTSMKHFGVSNPNKVRSVRMKIEQTCLKQYGAKSHLNRHRYNRKLRR